jgi:hypothetical protein
LVLAGKWFWRENGSSEKMILAGKWFWRENNFGEKMVLAGKQFGRENSFGGKTVLADFDQIRLHNSQLIISDGFLLNLIAQFDSSAC